MSNESRTHGHKRRLAVLIASDLASDAQAAIAVYADSAEAERVANKLESDTETFWVLEVPFYE